MFLALAGLAASCGEEASQNEAEKPVKEVSPSTPAEAPKPSGDGEAEGGKDDVRAVNAERAEEDEGASEAVGAAEADAGQYEIPDPAASSRQYAASEEAAAAPDDPTMYLNVPKLGIAGAVVLDGEAGLEAGAMHLSGTGYPWLPGSNTYIAGHRVGFPGTGSDHIFYDLPSMAQGDEITLEDSNGTVYAYRVSEIFAVTPFDLWVTAPTGTDMVTLQVCTETPDDWWTIGHRLMESGPESGRLIVRATRVA